MKRNLEVSDTDSGLKIIISSNDPEEISKIKAEKQWYTEVVREHEFDSVHGKHHRKHHDSYGTAHKKEPE